MTKSCIKKTLKLIEIKLNKATSYEVVKSRLNYRLYSSELLSDRMQYEKER